MFSRGSSGAAVDGATAVPLALAMAGDSVAWRRLGCKRERETRRVGVRLTASFDPRGVSMRSVFEEYVSDES
jgi:hypothetical protein